MTEAPHVCTFADMTTPSILPAKAHDTARALAKLTSRPFANPVRSALQRHKMTQADLARRLGIVSNEVCQWARWTPEKPTRLPQVEYHAGLRDVLGIAPETWEHLRLLARLYRGDESAPKRTRNREPVKKARAATKPRRRKVATKAAPPIEVASTVDPAPVEAPVA